MGAGVAISAASSSASCAAAGVGSSCDIDAMLWYEIPGMAWLVEQQSAGDKGRR